MDASALWNPAMRALLSLVLVSMVALSAGSALACEKHLHGHQNSSDTNGEATKS
jgi:hypothetical protein